MESEWTILRKVRGVKSYVFEFEYVYEKLQGYFNFGEKEIREDVAYSLEDNINTKIALALFDEHMFSDDRLMTMLATGWNELSEEQQLSLK